MIKKKKDKYLFVYDHKYNNWYAIDVQSDKNYRFYGKILKKENLDRIKQEQEIKY